MSRRPNRRGRQEPDKSKADMAQAFREKLHPTEPGGDELGEPTEPDLVSPSGTDPLVDVSYDALENQPTGLPDQGTPTPHKATTSTGEPNTAADEPSTSSAEHGFDPAPTPSAKASGSRIESRDDTKVSGKPAEETASEDWADLKRERAEVQAVARANAAESQRLEKWANTLQNQQTTLEGFERNLRRAQEELLKAQETYLSAVESQSRAFQERLSAASGSATQGIRAIEDLAARQAEVEMAEFQVKERSAAVDRLIAEARLGAEMRIRELETQLDELQKDRLETIRALAKAQHAADQSQGVSDRLATAQEELERLRGQLDSLPSGSVDPVVLDRLRSRNSDLEAQVEALQSKAYLYDSQLAAGRKAEADLRLQTLAAESYRVLVGGYEKTIEDLRERLQELTERSDHRDPVPACSALEKDPRWGSPPRSRKAKDLKLGDLVTYLQDAMASADDARLYGERDIRCFIAGLASSRLMVLQGLSGTGKTSLPIAIARALQIPVDVVEVASGWRDPQDLIGYYNAFERRFHETRFLQALYKAQLPGGANFPYFIVLDELNLSRPEHYFSDFLSVLEKSDESPLVPLRYPADLGGLPQLFDQESIPLPPNVWFIGTSNLDETTESLADKTHDRSHQMELPRRPPSLTVRGIKPPVELPLSDGELQSAFAKAQQAHKESAQQLLDALDDSADQLAAIGIAWGNRLPKMVNAYVPVVMAAGGTLGEASDHIIATKILGKAERGRRLDDAGMTTLRTELDEIWHRISDQSAHEWPAVLARLASSQRR